MKPLESVNTNTNDNVVDISNISIKNGKVVLSYTNNSETSFNPEAA
jgi:hypothetical protein